LNAASNTVAFASTVTTLQRAAAGSFTFDLNDGTADTTLLVANNNATYRANLQVEGAAAIGTTLSTGIPGTYGTMTALMQSADNSSGQDTEAVVRQ
jgi:hypothetical protein